MLSSVGAFPNLYIIASEGVVSFPVNIFKLPEMFSLPFHVLTDSLLFTFGSY